MTNVTGDKSYLSAGDLGESELFFYVIFYKLTVPLLFSLVALFGIAGNLLVIYVVLSTSDMRRNTVNILLLNLAVRWTTSPSHVRSRVLCVVCWGEAMYCSDRQRAAGHTTVMLTFCAPCTLCFEKKDSVVNLSYIFFIN